MRRPFGIALAGVFGLLAVASTSVIASAATLTIPTLNNPVTSIVPPPFTLQETTNFIVSGPGFISLKGFGDFSALTSVTEKVYKDSTSTTPLSVYVGPASPTTGSYLNYFGSFYAGSYYAVVSGAIAGLPATLTSNIAAVPLPGAALLFGSAVAGLAAFRSRRRGSAIA